MPLDLDAEQLLVAIREMLSAYPDPSEIAVMRGIAEELGRRNKHVAVPKVKSFQIVAGDQPLRVRYYAHTDGIAPTFVFFHGGGFVMGSLDSHDALVRSLVMRSGWSALSIDYRLAPEHPYPAALDDAYSALLWAAGPEGRANGIDGAHIAVCGESAGGNIAAALTLAARARGGPPIAHQVLIYPALDATCGSKSHRDVELQCQLTTARMMWYWNHYLGRGCDSSDLFATPGRCTVLSGLPDATVITAEYDPLRDEGEDYANRLMDAGVCVTCRRFSGVYHGFANLLGLKRTDEALDYVAHSLRQVLG